MGVYEELEKATEELGDKIGDLGKALPEEPDIEQPSPPDGMPTWGDAVSGALIDKIKAAWEFAFDASLISGFNNASNVNFHNILECGNDAINESYDMVPEPTTILLFGLGALGLGVIRRKLR